MPTPDEIHDFAELIHFPINNIRAQYNWKGANYQQTLETKNLLREQFLTTHPNTDAREEAIRQILRWGGIFRGAAVFREIQNAETAREDLAMLPYHSRLRIASWSKILGIVWPEQYAIYDARVSLALNVICRRQGENLRFFMRPTRNENRNELLNLLHDHQTENSITCYFEQYMPLLSYMQAQELPMADIEMWLFIVGGRIYLNGAGGAVYHHGNDQIVCFEAI